MERLGLILLLLVGCSAPKQEDTVVKKNVFIITLDGLRWQELFTGADSLLIANTRYVNDTADLAQRFWRGSPIERREALMPFFWSTIRNNGVILGNRAYENYVNTTNTMLFSYPGYNEILTGFADDDQITSNNKINNPNTTVLEYIHQAGQFTVAAFGSWDVFPYIINEERSGIPVNAGFEPQPNPDETESLINEMQEQLPKPWSTVRNDAITHQFALQTLRTDAPNLVYISYGETDDFAHDGAYDQYLDAAYRTDQMIADLWAFLQASDQYKNSTLLITTDHGRGHEPLETWRSHGSDIAGASNIWIAAIGQDIKPLGEVKSNGQFYQNQIARTAAHLLDVDYDQPKAGPILEEILE